MTSAGKTDVFLAKLDPHGNHLWSRSFGDADAQGGAGGSERIVLDPVGNILWSEVFKGTVQLGGALLTSDSGYATTSSFIAKFDPSGKHVWSKSFSCSGAVISAGASGNVIASGSFADLIDFGSGSLASVGGADVFLATFTP